MSITAPPSDNSFFNEFLDDFFAECDEHLAVLRRDILALEPSVGLARFDPALLNEMLRSFHTLKGLAGMVGVAAIEQLAHQTESYLRALAQGQAPLTGEAHRTLAAGTQMIEQVLAAYREQLPPPDIAATLERLASLTAAEPPAHGAAAPDRPAPAKDSSPPLWRAVFVPSPQLTARGVNVNHVRQRIEQIGEIVRAVPQVHGQGQIAFEFLVATDDPAQQPGWHDDGVEWQPHTDDSAPAPKADQPPAPGALATSNRVRVDLTRIDEVIRTVGQLVVSRERLREQIQPFEEALPAANWRQIQETTLALERQLRQLRQGVMQMRLVPMGETFARMQFVARDLAAQLGRQVVLDIRGQATEIDKYVVERMLDPLLHLVRNAISHGIEPPGERVAQGKPPAGQLSLMAATANDTVLIQIADDGRGIDTGRVAQRARAQGLIAADQPLDAPTLLEIICAPGFSTREQADRVSGRGIGMEVVLQTVRELGGAIELDTAAGSGTRFTVRLPLTLAIIDALLVEIGAATFAVPMPAVREITGVEPERLSTLGQGQVMPYRGDALPLAQLARHFGPAWHSSAGRYALVLGDDSGRVGLLIDRVVGKREIVVRALADPLVQVAGLAGVTELGDGRPVLILDGRLLTRAAQLRGAVRPCAPPQKNGGERAMTARPDAGTYVLCELAGATYALPSALVRHIEMVEQLTPVPNAPPAVAGIVFSRGQAIPAVDLRRRFGIEPIPYGLRSRLLVVGSGDRTVGLIVDTAREFVAISAAAIQPPSEAITGLSGSYIAGIATLGERLVVLLDIDSVLQGADQPVHAPAEE